MRGQHGGVGTGRDSQIIIKKGKLKPIKIKQNNTTKGRTEQLDQEEPKKYNNHNHN
jgi:hypothetical protein